MGLGWVFNGGIGMVCFGRFAKARCGLDLARCGAFWSGSHGGVRSGIVVNGEVRQLWTG